MTLLITLMAVAFFVVAGIDLFRNRSTGRPRDILAAVHSPFVWAGLLTLTVLPAIRTGFVSWPMVVFWPFLAFGLATLVLNLSAYVYRNLRWRLPPVVTTLIVPALWMAALVATGWSLWILGASAMPPVLRQAEERGRAIEVAKTGMERSLVDMHCSLAEFQVPTVEEESNFQQIRMSAQKLIELADTLIAQHTALVNYHDEFLRQFKDAPTLFRAAAKVWRDYGKEERVLGISEIGDRYDEVAQLWEAYATAISEAEDDPFSIDELQQVMLFVRRARLLLERLVTNTPFDSAADFLSRKAEFEANLRLFVERFDELRSAIHSLTRQLREEPSHPLPLYPQATPDSHLSNSPKITSVPPRCPLKTAGNGSA